MARTWKHVTLDTCLANMQYCFNASLWNLVLNISGLSLQSMVPIFLLKKGMYPLMTHKDIYN